MKSCICLVLLAAVFAVVLSKECEKESMYSGCNVAYGDCVCKKTMACENPFPYKNHKECKKDLKGNYDKCAKEPCVHGVCVQIKNDVSRSYECQCAGTGFYGKKCQNECPPKSDPMPSDYPSACVMYDGEEL